MGTLAAPIQCSGTPSHCKTRAQSTQEGASLSAGKCKWRGSQREWCTSVGRLRDISCVVKSRMGRLTGSKDGPFERFGVTAVPIVRVPCMVRMRYEHISTLACAISLSETNIPTPNVKGVRKIILEVEVPEIWYTVQTQARKTSSSVKGAKIYDRIPIHEVNFAPSRSQSQCCWKGRSPPRNIA